MSVAVGLGPGARAEAAAPLTLAVNNVGRTKEPAPARASLSYEEFESKLAAIEEQDAAARHTFAAAWHVAELASGYGPDGPDGPVADAATRAAAEAAVQKSYDDWHRAYEARVKARDELKRAYPDYTARHLHYGEAPAPAVGPKEARAKYQAAMQAANEADRAYGLIADAAVRQALSAYLEAKIADEASEPEDDGHATKKASKDVWSKYDAYQQARFEYDQAGVAVDHADADVNAAREVWIRAELAAQRNGTSKGGGRPMNPLADFVTALTSPQGGRGLPGPVKAIVDTFNPSVGGGHRLLDPVGDFVHSFVPLPAAKKAEDKKAADEPTGDQSTGEKKVEHDSTGDEKVEDKTTAVKTTAESTNIELSFAPVVKAIVDTFNPSVGGGHRLLDPVGDFVHSFAPIPPAKKAADKTTANEKTADGKAADKKAADKTTANEKTADGKAADKKAAAKKTAESRPAASTSKTTSRDAHDSDGETPSQPTTSDSGSDE